MRLKDCPHFTDERVAFFHLRVLLKQYSSFFLLAFIPFVTGLRKHVSVSCEHLHFSFTIGQQRWLEFLFAYALTFSMLLLVLGGLFTVVCPLFGLSVLVLLKAIASFLTSVAASRLNRNRI